MLSEKYKALLELGSSLGFKDGFVEEKDGKLHIGGIAPHQYDSDRLWDKIKSYPDWEAEIAADIKVENQEVYGLYTVQPGDSLSKISKLHFGSANRYMEIFNINTDILKNPNLIKVGQELKLPHKSGGQA